MDHKELLAALNTLKVQTGSLACLGCGYEHDCSVHGCAVLRAAVEQLETQHPDAGELLTLEQLRKVQHGKVKDSTLKSICARANEISSSFSRIDRKAWEPCEDCISCGNCVSATEEIESFPCAECISDDGPGGSIRSSMKYFVAVGFCKKCGRPLTNRAWDELEKQLRKCKHES